MRPLLLSTAHGMRVQYRKSWSLLVALSGVSAYHTSVPCFSVCYAELKALPAFVFELYPAPTL